MRPKRKYYIPLATGFRDTKGRVYGTTVTRNYDARIAAAVLRDDVIEHRFDENHTGGGIFWTIIISR